MGRQDIENLFRRYKGQVANITATTGAVYRGRIVEITNDYVAVTARETEDPTFVFFTAIESVVVEDLEPHT